MKNKKNKDNIPSRKINKHQTFVEKLQEIQRKNKTFKKKIKKKKGNN